MWFRFSTATLFTVSDLVLYAGLHLNFFPHSPKKYQNILLSHCGKHVALVY